MVISILIRLMDGIPGEAVVHSIGYPVVLFGREKSSGRTKKLPSLHSLFVWQLSHWMAFLFPSPFMVSQ